MYVLYVLYSSVHISCAVLYYASYTVLHIHTRTHCLLGLYASLLESDLPQSSGGSTAKRYKREDVLDKVLYSPLSEEFLQWKEKTIREARKALALSPMS